MPKAESGENGPIRPGALALNPLFGVAGKAALITGGGSGIGAMIANTLVQNGCHVVIVSRKNISSYAQELNTMGPGKCESLPCDLTKIEDMERLTVALQEKFPAGLHILVNNSGTNFSAPIDKYPIESFDKVMRLNVTSVFGLTKVLKPLLEKSSTQQDPARVVNIASNNGLIIPQVASFAYTSSKAACIHLTKHLAVHMGPAVTVNAIAPGPFPSRMMRETLKVAGEAVANATITGKLGQAEDIGGAVIFLCSRAGANVTGTTVVCDGGGMILPSRL